MQNPDVLHLEEAVAYKFIESKGYLVYFQYTNFSACKQSFHGHVGILMAMAGIAMIGPTGRATKRGHTCIRSTANTIHDNIM